MSELEQSGIPSKQFIMTGPRPDTHNYYPAMDIKLISSRYEGVAVTALEAMSAGLPVVSTNVGGMADVVSRTTGVLVPPSDPAALADATLKLIDNKELRQNLGNEARRQAVERFGINVSAEAHRQAFELAIAHKRARDGSFGKLDVKQSAKEPAEIWSSD